MYRRGNLTGVNPLVYYLVGANRTLGERVCVYIHILVNVAHVCRENFKRLYARGKTRVYLVALTGLMGIYGLSLSLLASTLHDYPPLRLNWWIGYPYLLPFVCLYVALWYSITSCNIILPLISFHSLCCLLRYKLVCLYVRYVYSCSRIEKIHCTQLIYFC